MDRGLRRFRERGEGLAFGAALGWGALAAGAWAETRDRTQNHEIKT